MIGKELLSNVLGLTVVKVLELDDTILWYKGIVNINGSPYSKELNINIYELAHKCKEWAYTRNYLIDSCFNKPQGEVLVYWMSKLNKRTQFNDNTEVEAIFKACEWILTKELA